MPMTRDEATMLTKTALAASLKRFMDKKPLGKITVSEIIADCNVNRKTFYYHFEDIYALLKWMLEQETVEVVKSFDLLLDFEDAIRFAIRYVRDNVHILNCAYDGMGRDAMKRFFFDDFFSVTESIIIDAEERYQIKITADFRRFLANFFTEAIAGMMVRAFHENEMPQEDVVVRNLKVILDALTDILSKAPKEA